MPLSSLPEAINASYIVCVCANALNTDSAKVEINNKCFFIFSFSLCYYLRPLVVAPPERAPPVLRVLPPPRLGVKELPLLTELRFLISLEEPLRLPRSVAVVFVLFTLFVLFERFTSLFAFLCLSPLFVGRETLPFVFLVFEFDAGRASLPLVLPSR